MLGNSSVRAFATRTTRLFRMAAATTSAIALLAATAACGSAASNSSDGTPTVTFMLDWTPNTNHVGLYVAQKLGYFKDAGINVTILPTAQAGAETSVENGVANVGFTTLSNVAAFNAQGADLKFVFDLTQKPVARWCALASRTDIKTPKDLSGKTFVSFGSAEQSAVVKQMIKYAGGTGTFSTATTGTNTFETLTSGKGDFGGFYVTWENVQSELNGPKLHCFVASDWGVPGNPDQLGYAVKASWAKDASHAAALRKFIHAAQRGYDYALKNPDKAADILVDQTPTAQLDSKLARRSMEEISSGHYWTTTDPTAVPGTTDLKQAQAYLDFQFAAGTYTNADGKTAKTAPQASELSTGKYLSATNA
ncbi:putative solute binding protein of ABC transporter [Bifidobacterium minimum]|uniref:Thiamine pyrimidine synthase n=2 Tax=Bifidobacterium minimum TaxID=1693 RepID=A0A087BRD7_9BIFI|nr:ABC transporter substrate-binding protein [Bifidobacterium minimum]KFI73587.1 putative solute binding protein of ABC transporter [Bifidobacterium minimum]